jgi:FkbM family methyltransferase
MFTSSYDNYIYNHNDPVFHYHIERGLSEPYPKDFSIVKKYQSMFPHKNRDYVDVGGHIGTTVIPFLKIFRSCVAFEPTQENYNFLVENVKANHLESRCILRKLGCSDKVRSGNTRMHSGGNSGCFYFEESSNNQNEHYVETVCMDDDPDIQMLDIDFIKIDTEGHELFVLRGAEQTLLRCKPLIQFETNGMSDSLFGISKQEIFNYLYSLGAREFDTSDGANTYFYFPNISLTIQPRTVFSFWTGTNPITDIRRRALATIPNVKLITPENLNDFILQSEPLHPAFQYLSETHKADYLRTYFMNFYGGGYADIKIQKGSWDLCFSKMSSGRFYACGYKEAKPNDVAHPDYVQHWDKLIGNCSYIVNPYTDFTKEWYGQMIQFLDSIYPILSVKGAQHPQDCAELGNGYPIEWNQMLGRIFHPLVYKYHSHILQDLTAPEFNNYR